MSDKVDRGAKVNEAVLEALRVPVSATAVSASAAAPVAPSPILTSADSPPRGTGGSAVTGAPGAMPRSGPRTWVGRVAEDHNAGLKGRIAELENERSQGLVVLKLDPKRIQPSGLANRHQQSLSADDESLRELTDAIRDRGQLEPIRVRPAPHGGEFDYEIVYGHRRHAVALALDAQIEGGWAVLALLDASASDARDHVLKMYQENAARKDLSAYETGSMFRSWLDAGVFAGQAAIAAATGLSEPSVSKYLRVASLPGPVLEAFRDPRAIALRWTESLVEALKADESAVLAIAAALARDDSALPPEQVLRRLLEATAPRKRRKGGSQSETVKIDGRTAFAYSLRNERIAIRFGRHVDRQVARELTDEIKELLTRRLRAKFRTGGK